LKAQDAAFAAGPVGAQAAGGLPLKKSAHEYAANAVTHFSTVATVFPVLGAASPSMQASASRVSHAASVPKERTRLAPVASMASEQLIRFAHWVCARFWQACSIEVPDPHPCAATINPTASPTALIDSFIVAVWSRTSRYGVIATTAVI
jgi:hypothetical protein